MARANTHENPVVLNVSPSDDNAGIQPKNDKKQDTLFGPNIGVIANTPSWAQPLETKQQQADNLSPEVIKSWIAKSKQPSQPTTTLQALVNLKRPSLRLVPLSIAPTDDPDSVDSHHHHGLEFEYDCDAPRCRMTVHVVLPSDHPLADPATDSSGISRVMVYENVLDGGFNKLLKLDEGATLELGKYELRHDGNKAKAEGASASSPNKEGDAEAPAVAPAAGRSDSGQSSGNNSASGNGNGLNDRRSRRFTAFNFRKRHQSRSISGPALAVVDASVPSDAHGESDGDEKPDGGASEEKDSMKDGVRIAIKLAALDGEGFDLPSANEQMTYLHVVRVGSPPPADEEDHRSWVVKVVKREATIGPHTFHLHEIYGLAAQSSSHSADARPAPTAAPPGMHTYPPAAPPAAVVTEDEPSSECLLCLSSPREVILLPCRHLVACKECAINMVEFGAGGNIVHSEETPTAAPGGGEAGAAEAGMAGGPNAEGGAPTTVAPTVPAPNPRRKRKAKGWFCPVCRQPYTSLLRISTTPTAKELSDDDVRGNRASTSSDAAGSPTADAHPLASVTPAAAAATTVDAPQQQETSEPQGGMLRGLLRTIGGRGGSPAPEPAAPANSANNESATLPPDLERGPDPAPERASADRVRADAS